MVVVVDTLELLVATPIIIRRKDGFVKTGILKSYTEKKLYLEYYDGRLVEIDRESIDTVEPDDRRLGR